MIRRDQWPHVSPDQPKPAAGLQNDYMLFLSAISTAPGTSTSTPSPTASRPGSTSSGTPARSIRTRSRSRCSRTTSRANQIQTNYYYNATPGAAQRDIKSRRCNCATRWSRWRRTTRPRDPAAFATQYGQMLADRQKAFGAPGHRALASPSTERAEAARRRYFDRSQWLPGAPLPDQASDEEADPCRTLMAATTS